MIYCEKIRDYVDQEHECMKCKEYNKEEDSCQIEMEDIYIKTNMPDFTEN